MSTASATPAATPPASPAPSEASGAISPDAATTPALEPDEATVSAPSWDAAIAPLPSAGAAAPSDPSASEPSADPSYPGPSSAEPEPERLGPIGRWIDTADGQHWWFDPGCPSLDFAYSGAFAPVMDGRATAPAEWEVLSSPETLATWLHDRFPGIDATCADHELRDALTLREAIANLTSAARNEHPYDPRDVDIVNLYASTPDLPPALPGGSRQAGRTHARAAQALSAIARDAVALFGSDARDRLRECAADDCSLVYLDVSRSRNRRWCSMQRCGNRAKVRAHRARKVAGRTDG